MQCCHGAVIIVPRALELLPPLFPANPTLSQLPYAKRLLARANRRSAHTLDSDGVRFTHARMYMRVPPTTATCIVLPACAMTAALPRLGRSSSNEHRLPSRATHAHFHTGKPC
eukprot:99501-Pyramimonas_sp.AAC.1